MSRYGYARVSTDDQHPEIQEDRLTAAGCDRERIFTDTISGTRSSRPEWDKLLALLAPGDELACVRLDRIGRSARHLHNLFEELKNRQVGLVCVDQGIDTTRGKGWDDPMAQLLIGVLSILAEFERTLIIERTLDGQARVRRRGNLRRSLGGLPPLGFRYGDAGDDDWQVDQPAADWLADAAERVLNGDEVEAVHGMLPVIHDAAGREVSAKMLRAALQRPASRRAHRRQRGIPARCGRGSAGRDDLAAAAAAVRRAQDRPPHRRRPLPARPAAALRQVRQPANRRAGPRPPPHGPGVGRARAPRLLRLRQPP